MWQAVELSSHKHVPALTASVSLVLLSHTRKYLKVAACFATSVSWQLHRLLIVSLCERQRAPQPTDSTKIISSISMGGGAAPSPYTGNSVCSHPCCRWNWRRLGRSPLTDLHQLIRINNYTLWDTHTHMQVVVAERWTGSNASCDSEGCSKGCSWSRLYLYSLSWFPLILLFHSFHVCFQLSVFWCLFISACGGTSAGELSGVTAKWIFHCSRMKSVLPSIETHRRAWVAISVRWNESFSKGVRLMILLQNLFILMVLHLSYSCVDIMSLHSSSVSILTSTGRFRYFF